MAKLKKDAVSAKTTATKSAGKFSIENWTGWKLDVLAGAGLYIAMAVLYYPVLYLGQITSLSPDTITAAAMNRASAIVLRDVSLPLWNPYMYCGMPMFAAYQIGLFVNPIWYLVKPIGFLFGGDSAVIFVYMWLGALGIYYVVRELGENRGLAFVSGLIWLWLPALVVLPDVGHGSKLMSSDAIPWLLWGTLRVINRKAWWHVGVLALLVGTAILSLHAQITYYGFMLIGWVVIWELICAIRDKKIPDAVLKIGKIAIASLIGVGISLIFILPVLDFAGASSRGATAGGVDWNYATQWSFHPLETITFLWPTFFGFGGQTYWGYMPFTDMPLTFGIVALVGAILAVWLKRDRMTWFLLILGVVAWMISWGNFLPVLFKPFFEFLPMFKKFRVPSLILILTQLSMIVLAARGYGAVFDLAEEANTKWIQNFRKFMIWCASAFVVFLVLALMMSGSMKQGFANHIKDQYKSQQQAIPTNDQLLQVADQEMWPLAFTGGIRSFFILAGLGGLVYLAVRGTIKRPVVLAGLIIAVAIDFLPMIFNSNRPLVGFTTNEDMESYFAETPRLKFLKQQPGLFRVLPNDRSHAVDWWTAAGLQNATGYSGVRLSSWDKFQQSQAMSSPAAWRAFNIKYFATDRPIRAPFLTEVSRDQDGYLYEIQGAMPRAYFAKTVVSVSDQDAAEEKMASQEWNPAATVFVEKKTPANIEDTTATVEVTKWNPNRITIKTHRKAPGLLIVAEIAAPHWDATVNGNSAETYTVNAVLRGVEVPAGDATVEYIYTAEKGFMKGFWLSVASTILAFLIILVGWWMGRKRGEEIE